MKITIPNLSLVVLVGSSGSGKSTFARKHFKPTEILSSDTCRGLVSDDENDMRATKDAFDVLYFIASRRLSAGRLTVLDATNVQAEARKPALDLARSQDVFAVAIVLLLTTGAIASEPRAFTTVAVLQDGEALAGAHDVDQVRAKSVRVANSALFRDGGLIAVLKTAAVGNSSENARDELRIISEAEAEEELVLLIEVNVHASVEGVAVFEQLRGSGVISEQRG